MSRPVVYLHIGAMKTGTTYLQQVMIANRDALGEAGHHFARRIWARQVHATQDLLGLDQDDPRIAALSEGAWPALVTEVLGRREGSSVVSMEFLSFARRAQVERVARDLAGAEVHVVLTLRDATSTIPAQWQTSITSGSTHSWADFQAGVRRSTGPLWPIRAMRDSGAREFRRTQDAARMLKLWGTVASPERLHVVLVPRGARDQSELWRRFAAAIDLDPALATEPAAKSNPSLGRASTELVRRINLGLGGREPVRTWDFNRTVKGPLAAGILGERRALEGTARLDASTAAFARRWNRQMRAAITAGGYPVLGDLEVDLPVGPVSAESEPRETGNPEAAEVLEAARAAYAGLTALVAGRRRRVARILGAERPQPLPEDGPNWMRRTTGGAADLDRAVLDLTALTRTAIGLRREMVELREDRRGDTNADEGSDPDDDAHPESDADRDAEGGTD